MNLMSNLPIKFRLGILVFVLVSVGLANSLMGISGMDDAKSGMEKMFRSNMHHAELLGKIAENNHEMRTLLLLSLQHDPSSDFAKMHDHRVSLHIEAIRNDMDTINNAWTEYLKTPIPNKLRKHVDIFAEQMELLFNKGYLPAIARIEAGEFKSANFVLLKTINPTFTKILKAVDAMIEHVDDEADKTYQSTVMNYEQMVATVFATLTIGTIISIILAYVIISGLGRGVRNVELAANLIAEGDLNARVEYSAKDEVGHIASAVNHMAETFRVTVNEVKDATSRLASAAEEASVVTAQTTDGINQQQSETNQVATAMNQMSATVQEVARNAIEAATAAEEATTTFTDGKQVIDQVIQGIDDVSGEVERASDVVSEAGTGE